MPRLISGCLGFFQYGYFRIPSLRKCFTERLAFFQNAFLKKGRWDNFMYLCGNNISHSVLGGRVLKNQKILKKIRRIEVNLVQCGSKSEKEEIRFIGVDFDLT